ncbi:EAL domain-containing protein [Caballeronia calidae]|uniref:EAL domain-containing protein n=1 Tax=Caballeronia calidae TaxID=1777139 RepID=UPI001E35F9D3|nr:EAL domain-containing protein [Caballeronia calidae]
MSWGTPHRILNEVRALGVTMDGFGTGYSSLSLQSFPFTRVKIDRGFVNGLGRNPKSGAIVRAITELCRTLGLPIIDEGVETEPIPTGWRARADRRLPTFAQSIEGEPKRSR